jgi:heme-degrading monooxygenase HmoA
MYARVTTVAVQPDKIAETIRIYNESVLPAIKAAAGNQGVYLLMDEATGMGLSVTLWATEADGQAYDTSGTYRELVGKVATFFSAPPSLATYTVGAQG